jgi:hypothetical protein
MHTACKGDGNADASPSSLTKAKLNTELNSFRRPVEFPGENGC